MKIKDKGYTLIIDFYNDPISPRDFVHLGKMLCWHHRYKLGDINPYRMPEDFWKDKALQDEIFVKLNIYGNDREGMKLSHFPFSEILDDTVGVIFATKKSILQYFGDLSDKTKEMAIESLSDEIREFNEYLTCTAYQFAILNEKENILESLCGFVGESMSDVIISMKEEASKEYEFLFDKMLEQHLSRENQKNTKDAFYKEIKTLTETANDIYRDYFQQYPLPECLSDIKELAFNIMEVTDNELICDKSEKILKQINEIQFYMFFHGFVNAINNSTPLDEAELEVDNIDFEVLQFLNKEGLDACKNLYNFIEKTNFDYNNKPLGMLVKLYQEQQSNFSM